jgi:subtilisin family serine protease
VPSNAQGTGLGNYAITYVNGALTVTPAQVTITANNQSKGYGTSLSLGGSAFTTSGTLFNGDQVNGVMLTSSGAPASAGVAGNPYAIVPSNAQGTGLGNYAITYVNGALTVAPASLTVTANPETVSFGSTIPTLTYVVSGSSLVNGDLFNGALATTATPTSAEGQYPIVLGTLGNPNYAITYVSAPLTIIPPRASPLQPLPQNLFNNPPVTVSLTSPGEVVNTGALNQPPRGGPPPGAGGLPPEFGSRFFVLPPADPTLFVQDEVVLQIPNNIPQAQLQQLLTSLGLTIISSTPNRLLGVTSYRMHINSGKSVASVVQAVANLRIQIVAGAQANQRFFTTQEGGHELADDPTLAGLSQEGDAAQYALSKLGLIDVHRQLRGSNITIAVIDSQIDVKHPDLDGVIADSFDAVGAVEPAHAHGTGMAGAIASHRRLMGIAPSAQIYAVHAFSSGAATAESTTFSILKGLDWAASKGVRVINMSFAGPRDPSLERAMKNAHDRGIVLIAAAGNAGPKSPPLYPAADPNVIAVTATDANDKIFSGANRGAYIAVAAPGVDILVPAPEASYQLTTGTSVASAEVSGIVALLLERNPKLTPEDVRTVLTTSAKKLGASTDFGSGLVNPLKAIQTAADFISSEMTATVPPPATAPKPPAAAPRPPGSRPAPDTLRSGPKPASVPTR